LLKLRAKFKALKHVKLKNVDLFWDSRFSFSQSIIALLLGFNITLKLIDSWLYFRTCR